MNKIVIIGAGPAGLLLKAALRIYNPNFKIYILEKKKIDKDKIDNFFLTNAKYLHPNVFSNLFKILLKKYLNKIYNKIYDLNLFKYFFYKHKNITKEDFFKVLLDDTLNDEVEVISGFDSLDLNFKNNNITSVTYTKNMKSVYINCDYVFDCSGGNNFFQHFNNAKDNVIKIEKINDKILITFNLIFLNSIDKNKIDRLINSKDITINYDQYDLTIMKQNTFYSFTYVANIKKLNKLEAQNELKRFLSEHQINNYQSNKPIQWIHKKSTFNELKNTSVIKNLIPIGDSFFSIDPANGMGITSILFQVIYIAKKIKIFNFINYMDFSKDLFLLISDEKKLFKFKGSPIRILISQYKKFIPLYGYLRTRVLNYNDQKLYRKLLKKL